MAGNIHFVGVAGVGMSALAQLRALEGHRVTGSDRLGDDDSVAETRRRLEKTGVEFLPQDGSGVEAGTQRVVVSTAIEDGIADLKRARELGVKVSHRADELASVASERRTVAIAGTSGKSTVTAMVYHVLEAVGRAPSLVTGANLSSLRRRGFLGNAALGRSDLLVIEADESDGTLTRYSPALGVLLNISKDHKETAEIFGLFEAFKSSSARFVLNADAPALAALAAGAATFGFSGGAVRGSNLELEPDCSRFKADGAVFRVPFPGRHNAENALAAAAACLELGVPLRDSADALASFEGVARRFESLGRAGGVEVIDDYAHNPEKVRAVLAAARLRSRRLLAVFQLHGFAPARFMKNEFIDAFAETLSAEDVLWLPEIYYVGGTAAKDVSARDYADSLRARGKDARYAGDRRLIPRDLAAAARPGNVALVMGARDPSLPQLAADILAALSRR